METLFLTAYSFIGLSLVLTQLLLLLLAAVVGLAVITQVCMPSMLMLALAVITRDLAHALLTIVGRGLKVMPLRGSVPPIMRRAQVLTTTDTQ